MMKNRKVYSRLSILVIIILLLAGTQVLAVTLNRVTNVKAKPTANAVTVTWNKVTNAKEYEVSIYIPGIGYVPQPRVKTTSKYISGLDKGETYKVKVRAISGSSSGQYSTEVSFRTSNSSSSGGSSSSSSKPARVTGLRTTRVTNDAVTLTWNRSSGATGYKVYVYIPGMGYTYVQNVTGTTATVTGFRSVTGNENGLNYRAKIIAFNSSGDAAESAEVNFRTPRSSSSGGGTSSSSKPAKVTGLKTTNITNNAVSLAWNSVSGATGYKVYIEVPGYGYSYIGLINKTYVTITGLDSITAYKSGSNIRAKVIATNSAGDAPEALITFKAPASGGGTSSSSRPTKVTGLKTTNITNNAVSLAWNSVSGATGYKVYIEVPGYGYSYIGLINKTYVTITGLDSITAYKSGSNIRAKVIATNSAGDAPEALITFKAPASSATVDQVRNLRASSITNNAVFLTWDAVSNAAGYEVYVYIPGLGYVFVRTTTNIANEEVSGFQAGETYRAKVRAYRMVSGRKVYGAYSNEILFSPKREVLGKVTGLNITPSTNKATISWDIVAGATEYELAVNGSTIGKTTQNRVTLTGLQPGTTYRVKVRAYNGTTPGAYSDEKSFKTNSQSSTTPTTPTTPAAPGKVTGLQVSNVTTNSAKFTFNAVSGADGYRICIKNSKTDIAFTTSQTTVSRSGLSSNTEYTVTVEAYKIVNGQYKYGDKSDSKKFKTNQDLIKIGKASKVTVTNITTNGATFTYGSVNNATGYSLSIRKQGESKANLSMSVRSTSTNTAMLEPGKTYYVKVRGYTVQNGQVVYGEYSDETMFTTVQNYKVKNLKLDSVKVGMATISWENIQGASYYMIWAKEENKPTYSPIGGTKSSPTSISLKAGKTYDIIVFAQYKDGSVFRYGPASNSIKVTIPAK